MKAGDSHNERDSWRGRNVLVTGATGFVGRWLVRALLNLGAAPIVLLRDMTSEKLEEVFQSEGHSPVKVVLGDICNLRTVSRAFSEYEVEVCYHLAAQTIVGTAKRSPMTTFESNVRGTWNLLEGARRSEMCRLFVLASTDKVYGEPQRVPISEDHPLLGVFPYDCSKVCAELVAGSFLRTYGLDITITRCSNIYGGGDTSFSRIVPGTMRSVVLGHEPEIRGDGNAVRDFLYIEDAIAAFLAIVNSYEKANLKGEAVNLGTATPTTIMDLVRKIIDLSGKRFLTAKVLGLHQSEIRNQYLDSSKAKNRLGWEPKVSLMDGLTKTWNWYATTVGKT